MSWFSYTNFSVSEHLEACLAPRGTRDGSPLMVFGQHGRFRSSGLDFKAFFFPFRVSHDLKLPISSGKRERKSESAQQADQGSDGWTGVTLGSPGVKAVSNRAASTF